jgi:hypothetical protein
LAHLTAGNSSQKGKKMTTFTTDDREEEYKKIVAAAPNQPGYEDAIPIPFAGWVEDSEMVASPPHIVDSGSSVMIKDLTNEEISNIRDEFLSQKDCDIYIFARAILRKAQEK